jgi:hypothetical protein
MISFTPAKISASFLHFFLSKVDSFCISMDNSLFIAQRILWYP